MKRLVLDIALAGALAGLPYALGAGVTEAKRMLILACVYTVIAAAAHFRLIAPAVRRAGDLAFGVVLLALAWFQSFPAWNHSADIGLYIAFGAVVLAAGVSGGWRHAARTSSPA